MGLNQYSPAYLELRDRFAAAALQGMLAEFSARSAEEAARQAYVYADAMMAERNK